MTPAEAALHAVGARPYPGMDKDAALPLLLPLLWKALMVGGAAYGGYQTLKHAPKAYDAYRRGRMGDFWRDLAGAGRGAMTAGIHAIPGGGLVKGVSSAAKPAAGLASKAMGATGKGLFYSGWLDVPFRHMERWGNEWDAADQAKRWQAREDNHRRLVLSGQETMRQAMMDRIRNNPEFQAVRERWGI